MVRIALWIVYVGLIAASQPLFAQQKRDARHLFEAAETAHESEDYQQALTLLDECLKLDPGFMEAYMKRGATRDQLNDVAGALTDYSIYLEKVTEDPDARLARGLLHFRQAHYDLAREDFQRLMTMNVGPTNMVLYRQSSFGKGTDQVTTVQSGGKSYLLNYLGLCDTQLKNYPQAIHSFDSAILLDPREADYYVNRGIAKEGSGDSTAHHDYQKALTLVPGHGIAQHNLSVLKSKAGDKETAENLLDDLLTEDSTMQYAYIQRAYQRLEAGYYKGALEDYDAAIEMKATNPELFMSRGIVKEKMKDFQGAFSDYTKAIDLKENMEKAWLNRGNVLSKLNRTQDAIDDYTVAITHAPEFAAAFYNRGIAKYKLKLAKEACDDLRTAEKLGFKGEEKTVQKICGAN